MNSPATALALSALSLVESLLLELREKGIIEEHDMVGLLEDVISAHKQAAVEVEESSEIHLKVASLVRLLGEGGNPARALERLQAEGDSAD